jgi:DNA recombination protein RmuC
MEIVIIILLVLLIFFAAVILFRQNSNKVDPTPQLLDLKNQINELQKEHLSGQTSALAMQQNLLLKTQSEIREQLGSILTNVQTNLSASQSNIASQLKNSNEVINEIQKKLGSLEITTKNIQEIGKDISSLQDILKAPKLRGNLGEYLLEELLKEIFPSQNYQIKYSFKNGTQVDAIIRLGEGIVPIDSKFPLESFQRLVEAKDIDQKRTAKREFIKSVQGRIDEIAKKYINPAEGTFDFAMMYIPAENVFYETVITDSLTNKDYEIFNYAIKNHVIPVSPNSFYAYLMAIVYGLRGFKIEQRAKTIIGELSQIQEKFGRFFTDFTMLGKHLGNAGAKYEETVKRAEKLNDQINRITENRLELSSFNENGSD